MPRDAHETGTHFAQPPREFFTAKGIAKSDATYCKFELARAASGWLDCILMETANSDAYLDINFLHELGKKISSAPLNEVLWKIVRFVADFVNCDSCFLYILDENELVLKASRNPHSDVLDRLRISVGQGITGWVAKHKMPVAIPRKAYQDPRFKSVDDLPEDQFEAFLSVPMMCRDRLVGVINVQHRQPKFHSRREIQLISIIGFLVAAEVELVRMESELAGIREAAKSETEERPR